MLNEKQIKIIRQFVSDTYFDVERLIKYLQLHDMVGIEVFKYVAKEVFHEYPNNSTVLPVTFIDETHGERFEPQTVDTFVRRIPFTFYVVGNPTCIDKEGKEQEVWRQLEITYLTYCVGHEAGSSCNNHRETPLTMEDAFQKLEFLYYEKGYSLEEIFSYTQTEQWCCSDDGYADWFDYIDMCIKLGWDDYMPKAFYYRYNLAREALGKDPIMFYIQEFDPEAWKDKGPDAVEYYQRRGNHLFLYGMFPVDEDGNPILKWIGVEINDADSVTTDYLESDYYFFHINIKLTPQTVIRALVYAEHDEVGNPIKSGGMVWMKIYAGPQTMSFNYKVMKERRKALGYTQKQVAEAIQTNVRTYQKWENGETTPDGYYLLRLLNWLDIHDVTQVIKYESKNH